MAMAVQEVLRKYRVYSTISCIQQQPHVAFLGDATLVFEIELFDFHGEDVTKSKANVIFHDFQLAV